MASPPAAALIFRRKVEFAPLSFFLRTAKVRVTGRGTGVCQSQSLNARGNGFTIRMFSSLISSISFARTNHSLPPLSTNPPSILHSIPSPLSPSRPFFRMPLFSADSAAAAAACKYLLGNGNSSVTSSKHRCGAERRGSWPLALNGNKMHDWSDATDTEREGEREGGGGSRREFNDSKK